MSLFADASGWSIGLNVLVLVISLALMFIVLIQRGMGGGLAGAFFATLGVVLPSFFIILLIAAVLRNLMKYAGVEAFLSGVRPCVVAMILATALTMALSTLLGITRLGGGAAVSVRSVAVFGILWAVHFAYKKVIKKAPSPIGMIVLAAGLGIVFWGI